MNRARRTSPVGEWAREARRKAGYASADEAAQAAGVPPEWLRAVEAGQIQGPGAERLRSLERLYGSEAPPPAARQSDEERTAELVMEAYERGVREGFR